MSFRFYKKIFVFVLIFIFLAVLNAYIFKNLFENTWYAISRPPARFFYQNFIKASNYIRGVLALPKILREEQSLRQENQKLTGAFSNLKKIEEENNILRIRLGLESNQKYQQVLANIFNANSDFYSSELIIDKGSSDGLKPGLAVVSAENILVGITSKVFERGAIVEMPVSPGLGLSVRVLGGKTLARTHGYGNGISLELVTNQDIINIGDILVTTGMDGLPGYLPVAKVTEVNLAGGNLFKSVKARPLFDIIDTTKVFIIIK